MDHREALHVCPAVLSWPLCFMREVKGNLGSQGPAYCHHGVSIHGSLTLSCSAPNETWTYLNAPVTYQGRAQ